MKRISSPAGLVDPLELALGHDEDSARLIELDFSREEHSPPAITRKRTQRALDEKII